jgi:hypothetical protein
MRIRVAGLACAVLMLVGCGGTETAESDNRTESPQATAAPTTVVGRCEKVSSAVLNAIAEGLTVTGGGTLRGGYAVKSKDFSKVYMVAADIQGTGMEGNSEVGVWATNSLDGTGLIFAVDGLAKEFSDWDMAIQPTPISRYRATAFQKPRNARASSYRGSRATSVSNRCGLRGRAARLYVRRRRATDSNNVNQLDHNHRCTDHHHSATSDDDVPTRRLQNAGLHQLESPSGD